MKMVAARNVMERRNVPDGPHAPVDALRAAAEIHADASGRRAGVASSAEIRALAASVLDLWVALQACGANDRSRPYKPGEARRSDGLTPQDAGASAPRWLTPKQIVESVEEAHR